ncbi:MAG: hypothetical protein QW587_04705 [Candidatus Bathyarchaeia archaeon]
MKPRRHFILLTLSLMAPTFCIHVGFHRQALEPIIGGAAILALIISLFLRGADGKDEGASP